MDLLVCLAERAGQTISKDEILDFVWPGQFIADSGLARCVAELRQALGDTARRDSKYIETIAKRGYRLIAPVTRIEPAAVSRDDRPLDAPRPDPPAPTDSPDPACPVGAVGPVEAPPAKPVRFDRPARLVGTAALILLVAGVAGAAAWWYLGASRLEPRRSVVLTFENRTGDPAFDEALRLALLLQLEQSPQLRVLSERRVREELGYMHLPTDAPLTRAVALDACRRMGAEAVVAGTVTALGRHFVIGLEGIGCGSGERLIGRQVEVDGKERVIAGLGEALSSFRQALGESVASIRKHDVPIVQATTGSLEALEAFSRGDQSRARGRDDDAVRDYRRAIELDPSFALAHVRLGLHLVNLGRLGEGVQALKAAYAVRDRASAGERLYITACYENRVMRNPIKAVESLETWRDAYPQNVVARYTLASMYDQVGRQEEALVEAREALRLDPGNAIAAAVIGQSLVHLGRLDEARKMVDDMLARSPDSVLLRGLAFDIAFLRGDRAGASRVLDWSSTVPASWPVFAEMRAGMAMSEGRIAEARRLIETRRQVPGGDPDATTSALAPLEHALHLAMLGATDRVAGDVNLALQGARNAETLAAAALAMAWAARAHDARAAALADRYLEEYAAAPDVGLGSDPWAIPAARALLAMARGRADTALDLLEPLRPYESGWRFGLQPPLVRGLALMQLDRPAEAAVEFDRVVARRGVAIYGAAYPLGLLQLARAKTQAGDEAGGRAAYRTLLGHWDRADTTLPALTALRAELARTHFVVS